MEAQLVTDFGGRDIAKEMVLLCINETGGANTAVISKITGLPNKILLPILRELNSENMVEYNHIVWRVTTPHD